MYTLSVIKKKSLRFAYGALLLSEIAPLVLHVVCTYYLNQNITFKTTIDIKF